MPKTTCLCVTGILEVEEEEVEDDPNDEILTELKQSQSSLKPLLQWKLRHLKDLLKKAKDQQARQQLWKKFEECDAKVKNFKKKIYLFIFFNRYLTYSQPQKAFSGRKVKNQNVNFCCC